MAAHGAKMKERVEDLTDGSVMYEFYGERRSSIRLEEQSIDGKYFLGSYEDLGTKRQCKFVKLDATDEIKDTYDTILRLSNLIQSPFVIVPEAFGYKIDGSELIVGYLFDQTIEELKLEKTLPKLFEFLNQVICPYWSTEIIKLLQVIGGMHERKVFHGSLSSDESYVFRFKKFHIINPLIDGSGFDDSQLKQHRDKDLLDFFKFLLNQELGMTDINWNMFEALFQNVSAVVDIKCFINHPVLKNSIERLNYYRDIFNCVGSERSKNALDNEISRFWSKVSTHVSNFVPWVSKLKTDTILDKQYRSKPNNVATYKTLSLPDLLRFIRNTAKHVEKDGPAMIIKLEREIEDMFPGLLSLLHNCCAFDSYQYIAFALE